MRSTDLTFADMLVGQPLWLKGALPGLYPERVKLRLADGFAGSEKAMQCTSQVGEQREDKRCEMGCEDLRPQQGAKTL
jgi:hypothetical protein